MVDTLCVDIVNGHSVDTLDVVPRSSELIVPSSIERSGGPGTTVDVQELWIL